MDFSKLGFSRRVPLILQTESAECGLACLAMVAAFHGNEIGLRGIRMQFPISLKGVTLERLMNCALSLNMAPRPLRLDIHELSDLQLPCILHWDIDHYVVLTHVSNSRLIIMDPADGERSMCFDDVSNHFTGVALELTPKPNFIRARPPESIRWRDLVGKVIGLKRSLWQIFLLALALEVFVVVAPLFNQWVIDHAIVANDRKLLATLAIGFGLLLLFRITIEAARDYAVLIISTSLNVQWLANIFQHLLSLPISFFERRHMGDIVSRFNSINVLQNGITTSFVNAILDGMMSIGMAVMIYIYSPLLAAISTLALILYLALRAALYRILRSASESQLTYMAREQSIFFETLRGIQTVKIFGRTEDRLSRWLNTVIFGKNCYLRTQRLSLIYRTGHEFIFGAENLIVIVIGALMVMDNKFTIGMLFAYISYKGQFSARVTSFVDKIFEFKLLNIHAIRLADIALASPEGNQYPQVLVSSNLESSIEIRNLRFRYDSYDPWVLDGISINIPTGESVAIIGPSGCGKTTLLKVLSGVIEAQGGEVLIGGIPLKQLGLTKYRSMIGVVMQNDTLFSGSISENISFFAAMHDQEWVEECAKAAALHDEIIMLPMGYSTLIGELGNILSGGQRQRLMLARALYKKPKILLLDEATSHLDSGNEKIVSDSISKLNITRIVVAHRAETIARCDRIISLTRKGKAHQTEYNLLNQPEVFVS